MNECSSLVGRRWEKKRSTTFWLNWWDCYHYLKSSVRLEHQTLLSSERFMEFQVFVVYATGGGNQKVFGNSFLELLNAFTHRHPTGFPSLWSPVMMNRWFLPPCCTTVYDWLCEISMKLVSENKKFDIFLIVWLGFIL